MSIRPSPLLGYNNNVRHRGKVFHIQTEDSGAKYGHIMTHLFTDGGRIVKSVKTSYAEYIGNERMSEIVREMMKQQHKAMFIALRDGKFDVPAEAGVETPASKPPRSSSTDRGEDKSPASAPPVVPRPAMTPPPVPRPARFEPGAVPRPAPAADLPPSRPAPPPLGVPPPPPSSRVAVEAPEELRLDIGAFERAAAVDEVLPAQRSSSDLPPPPSKLLREKTAAPVLPPEPSRRVVPGAAAAPASERRYAPTRPASIFGQARPQQGKSIFGEDVLGDSSLDEVILSYLADDLDDDEK